MIDEPAGTLVISRTLGRMLTTIQFNDEPYSRRIEIKNEGAGRMLPPEIDAKVAVTQFLPKLLFHIS